MRARAYIDGFNLYHGALEVRPACKWLDLWKLSERLLPHAELDLVRYFTARVGSAGGDPGAPQRQDVYWRALGGIERLTIHRGKFQTETRRLPLARESRDLVDVRVPEEKGSDVNLATYLVLDAAFDEMDVALVISDDHDLEEPLRVVRSWLDVRLIVASPRNVDKLARAVGADERRTIRQDLLADCQLPDAAYDEEFREVRRPSTWA